MDVLSPQLIHGLSLDWIRGGSLRVATCVTLVALLSSVFLLLSFKKRSRLPPGPRGLPILGNLLQFGSRPHRTISELHKKYGHILFLKLGSVPTVLVDSPQLAMEITREQDHVFSSRPQMTVTKIVGYDVHDFAMAPFGQHWRHVRRICVQELLNPKQFKNSANLRIEEWKYMIEAVTETAQAGKIVDMRDVLSGVSMAMICQMMLGRREHGPMGQNAHDLRHVIHEMFRLMGEFTLRDYVPALGWLDLGGFERDMRKVRRQWDEIFDPILQEHRDLASGKLPGGKPNDFVSVLLDMPGENGEPNLHDKTIKALILNMFAGATDTSGVLNEFIMAELLRNPEIYRRVQIEIDAVVGTERTIQESDIVNFPYLMSVVKETFRLHPMAPTALPRESMVDTHLQGYFIPKGTRVLINFFSMGRNDKIWSDPMKFSPERWADSNNTTIQDPKFRILPFGNGRRQCPGYALGTSLILITISQLIHAFDWSLPLGVAPETLDMEEVFGFTTPLRTRLQAIATPRAAHHLYA